MNIAFDLSPATRPDAESPASPPVRSTTDDWTSAALLSLGYLVTASLSLILTRLHGDIAYFWLSTALLLSRLAQLPRRRWLPSLLGCLIAGTVAAALFGVGVRFALPNALIVVGEAVIGALLLQHYLPGGRYFDTVPRVTSFALLVGVVMPAVSASGGAAAASTAFHMTFWHAWAAWFIVHALGTVTFMPIVVLLLEDTGRRRLADFDPRRGGTANLALAVVMASVTALVFGQSHMPLLFLPMLPLTFLTFRAGRFGAALGICILAAIGGALTLSGRGPATLFAADAGMVALFFQCYLAVTVATMLPMAAELNNRKTLARELQNSEAMFRLMADRSGDILLNLDVEGRIRYCSPSIVRFGGFDTKALVGKHSAKLIFEDDRIVAAAVHGRALARPNETFVYEYRAITAGDTMTWFETHTRAIVDSHGKVTGVVSAARDISHRKRAEAKLVDNANTDALTGVSNRRCFDEQLGKALRSPDPARHSGCLAIVDIDFFKRVNDTHGHPAGDAVLKAVASRLQPMLRAQDLVARLGGEEFGLVLWDLRLADADALCDRLREDIAAHVVMVGPVPVAVTVSIGIAELDVHKPIPELLAAADAALYRAKGEGRNCVRLAA